MRCTSWLLGSVLFGLMSAAQGAVDPAVLDRPAPTPIRASKIVLVGDSTTAAQNNALTEPMGQAKVAFDYTHLGPDGAALFATLVTEELARQVPSLRPLLIP